ncbi:MAG: radical SAM protein [Nanobdellota archaeon]
MEGFIESLDIKEENNKKYIVINFAGCNFNCPWCNTPHLLNSKEEFITDLKEIKNQINDVAPDAQNVLITGGEPLFQRLAVAEIATFCKDLGLHIALHTNASKPQNLNSLLKKGLINTLIVDFKSPLEEKIFEKITRSSTFFIRTRQVIEDFKESLEIIKKYNHIINLEFQTTIIPSLMFRKEDLLSIAKFIKNMECRWNICRFQPVNINSKSFYNIKPPSEFFLQDLKESIQKEHPQLRIDLC